MWRLGERANVRWDFYGLKLCFEDGTLICVA